MFHWLGGGLAREGFREAESTGVGLTGPCFRGPCGTRPFLAARISEVAGKVHVTVKFEPQLSTTSPLKQQVLSTIKKSYVDINVLELQTINCHQQVHRSWNKKKTVVSSVAWRLPHLFDIHH